MSTRGSLSDAWRALAVLTLARASMGVQFQSVPALADPLSAATGLGPVAIGWLTGLYLLPGVILAFGGGWLGARFGEQRMLRIGLLMMTVGAAIMLIFLPVSEFTGRIIAGCGGILLNVLVTKIVADSFPIQRLPVAMAILISSWPIGLALALAILPPLEQAVGLTAAMALPVALSGICLLLLRPKDTARHPIEPRTPVWPTKNEVWLVVLAGGVWAFYNVAFILLLVFGPSIVETQGIGSVEAAAVVSGVGWALVPGVIVGGWMTTRIGRPDAVMLVSFVAMSIGISMIGEFGTSPWLWLGLGLIFGPPGGAIMALPARAIDGPARTLGFGIYFTMYYVVMPIGPPLAAYVVASSNRAESALSIAMAALALAIICLVLFRLALPRRPSGATVRV